MTVSVPQTNSVRALLSDDEVAPLEGFLSIDNNLSQLIICAFTAAVGVMIALLLAVSLLPAPTGLNVTHSIILPSRIAALTVEPREKAFVGLALALGFAASFLAITVTRRKVELSKRTILSLLLLMPLFNVCCDRALNQPSGALWALFGLLGSVAIAWFALQVTPD